MNRSFVSGMTLGVVLSILLIVCGDEYGKYFIFALTSIFTGLVLMWLERKGE